MRRHNQLLAASRRRTSGDVGVAFSQEDNFVAVGKRLVVPSLNRFLGAFGLTGFIPLRSDIWSRPDRQRDRNAERTEATATCGGWSERRFPHGRNSTGHKTRAPC